MFFMSQVNPGETPLCGKVEMKSLPSLMNLENETPRLGLIDFMNHPAPQNITDL
jgi:hypothetical protein